jgi:hypothetical protein
MPMTAPSTPLTDVLQSLQRVDVCLRSLEELAGQTDDKTAHQIAVLAAYELDIAQKALQLLAAEGVLASKR